MTPEQEKDLERVTRGLADRGKLVEAGWISYLYRVVPPTAGPIQVDATRTAFFAGAGYLFESIMSLLEPGADASDKDLARMSAINAELHEFAVALQAAVKARGTAP